jgi:hypothetical protein
MHSGKTRQRQCVVACWTSKDDLDTQMPLQVMTF